VRLVRLLVFSALVWFSTTAHAESIYDFLSQSLVFVSDRPVPSGSYLPTDTITGFIDLSSALGPSMPLTDVTSTVLDYSFSDDRGAINPGNADFFSLSLGTDASGAIDAHQGFIFYEVDFDDPSAQAYAYYLDSLLGDGAELAQCSAVIGGNCQTISSDSAFSVEVAHGGSPGTWTLRPVPVPPAFLFLGSGFAAVLFRRRLS